MNWSVLEVTWDKGVAKSQWWSYWNLTRNHLLASRHPRPSGASDQQRPGEHCSTRHRQGVGKQEANSEQLEGIPEKQMMEMFQSPSQDFTKPLKEGVGTASSQQGWSVSHGASTSPATWEPCTPPLQGIFCGLFSKQTTCMAVKHQAVLQASSASISYFGCTPGKVLTHFTLEEARQPRCLKNNLLSLIIIHWYRTFHPKGWKKQFRISKQFSEWNSLCFKAHAVVTLECPWIACASYVHRGSLPCQQNQLMPSLVAQGEETVAVGELNMTRGAKPSTLLHSMGWSHWGHNNPFSGQIKQPSLHELVQKKERWWTK